MTPMTLMTPMTRTGTGTGTIDIATDMTALHVLASWQVADGDELAARTSATLMGRKVLVH